VNVQTPIGTKPQAESPGFASFHRREEPASKPPQHTARSSSADYEDIEDDDDDDDDPPLYVRISSTVEGTRTNKPTTKVSVDAAAMVSTEEAEAAKSMERAIAAALKHHADAGIETTLSPFDDESFSRSYMASSDELRVGKQRSSSGTSSSSTVEEMPQPKRVATVVQDDSNKKSKDI
jgi:hypothetical protein